MFLAMILKRWGGGGGGGCVRACVCVCARARAPFRRLMKLLDFNRGHRQLLSQCIRFPWKTFDRSLVSFGICDLLHSQETDILLCICVF